MATEIMTINTLTAESTFNLGIELGSVCRGGELIALNGELGVGKTWLAKGIGKGLHIAEPIHSPTFTLINEYRGKLPMVHVDFYRLNDLDEVFNLGLDEYQDQGHVVVIEWADKFASALPPDYLNIQITSQDDTSRQLMVTQTGDSCRHLFQALIRIKGTV
jgi:tRNA threonylcarbamoyladenosine biosynthesis protein TsaE